MLIILALLKCHLRCILSQKFRALKNSDNFLHGFSLTVPNRGIIKAACKYIPSHDEAIRILG